MKMLFRLMMFAAIAAGGARMAAAQEGPPPQMPPPGGGQGMRFQMPSFAEMDKNKDKKLSRDELPNQFPPQAFDRVDENKDGFIDEVEWNQSRQRFMGGGGGPQLGERFSRFMDENKDGKISREEFARINQMFDALDRDHNSELTQEELGRFFQAMSEVQAQATGGVDVNNLFQNTDKNKDGKITTDEMTDERLFRALDLNKDGSVPRDEAEQALKQINERRQRKQNQPQQ